MTTTSMLAGADTARGRPSLTRNETYVYGVLERAQKPLKAYDLLEALNERGIRSPMSIYRALKGLQSKGRVHKITHLNAFVCSDEDSQEDMVSVSFTCSTCEMTRLMSIPQSKAAKLFGTTDLVLDDFVLEATGRCTKLDCDNRPY